MTRGRGRRIKSCASSLDIIFSTDAGVLTILRLGLFGESIAVVGFHSMYLREVTTLEHPDITHICRQEP